MPQLCAITCQPRTEETGRVGTDTGHWRESWVTTDDTSPGLQPVLSQAGGDSIGAPALAKGTYMAIQDKGIHGLDLLSLRIGKELSDSQDVSFLHWRNTNNSGYFSFCPVRKETFFKVTPCSWSWEITSRVTRHRKYCRINKNVCFLPLRGHMPRVSV